MFCRQCGKELIPVETGKFDRNTGKPARHYLCPTMKQDHDGVYTQRSEPKKFLGLFPMRGEL